MPGTDPKWIVGEVTKNWVDGAGESHGLLCERFEEMLRFNDARGYELHSFQLHQLLTSRVTMSETIIAVFKRRED